MPEKYKVFLDSSVVLSGLNSSLGPSAGLIALFKLRSIEVYISEDVIEETTEVIHHKFPHLKDSFLDFLLAKPSVIKKLTLIEIKNAYKIINSEDAPILAGALKAKVNFLVTLDKRFIKLVKKNKSYSKNKPHLLLPSEFLVLYRKQSVSN